MLIVSKEEFCKYPNGTVFMLFSPEVLDDGIYIKTGYGRGQDEKEYWNGELGLTPFFKHDKDNESLCYTQWSTVDTSTIDYSNDQLFAVFSKSEVKQMINCLMFALCNCKTYLNQDIWFANNMVIPDEDMDY